MPLTHRMNKHLWIDCNVFLVVPYIIKNRIFDTCCSIFEIRRRCQFYIYIEKVVAEPLSNHPVVYGNKKVPRRKELCFVEVTIVGKIFIDTGYAHIHPVVYAHVFTDRVFIPEEYFGQ